MNTSNTWIQTYSGRAFDLLNPRAEDVALEDIAWSLANLCRFTGHVKAFYSVAEHSMNVANLVAREFKKEALLHDAVEAYIGDLSSPFKCAMTLLSNNEGDSEPEFHFIEWKIRVAIGVKFGVPVETTERVHKADMTMLATEAKHLLRPAQHDLSWGVLPRIVDVQLRCYRPQEAFLLFTKELREWCTP